jgi:hypothetical protein
MFDLSISTFANFNVVSISPKKEIVWDILVDPAYTVTENLIALLGQYGNQVIIGQSCFEKDSLADIESCFGHDEFATNEALSDVLRADDGDNYVPYILTACFSSFVTYIVITIVSKIRKLGQVNDEQVAVCEGSKRFSIMRVNSVNFKFKLWKRSDLRQNSMSSLKILFSETIFN